MTSWPLELPRMKDFVQKFRDILGTMTFQKDPSNLISRVPYWEGYSHPVDGRVVHS